MSDETPKQKTNPEKYLRMISAYEKQFKKWEGLSEKIIKRYRDEYRTGTRGYTESRFNILWSNIQTIVPAVFSRVPKPDVSRRFKDTDPVGRVASIILERALDYEVDNYPDYKTSLSQAIYDRFLGGRGTVWCRYEPHIVQVDMPEDGIQVTEDIDEPHEELDYECCPVDYVHWKDFGHQVARTWEEVNVVWRKVYMGRDALVERFGEELGQKIPLDTAPDDLKKTNVSAGSDLDSAEALIYEIWDKNTGMALWLSKSLGEFVDERQDPFQLEQFFPCPKPIYATLTNDSLEPTPDFKIYQDQANQLDILSDRIDGLVKALQVKGIYNSEFHELQRLFTEGENNTLIPVKNWNAFAEKNGLKGAVDIVDIQPIAAALVQAYNAMEQVKGQVHELTGLSDIIRGQSVASETATAQQIKGQYASLRLKDMQGEVARFAADIIRIKAQLMCNLFQPQTFLQFSCSAELQQVDQMMIPQAIQLLKSRARDFRIDIEADSLVIMDEQEEKQSRIEMLTAASGFLEKLAPAVEQNPQLAELGMEMLKFGIGAFKIGKTLEGLFDKTADQMKQAAMNPQPKPDPAMAKIQATQAAEQARMQADAQAKQADIALQERLEQFRAQLDERAQQRDLMHAQQMQQMQQGFEQWKAELDAAVKITTANISSKAKMNDIATQASVNEIGQDIRQ